MQLRNEIVGEFIDAVALVALILIRQIMLLAGWLLYTTSHNSVSTIPIPASVWLFASGLLGLVGMARRMAA